MSCPHDLAERETACADGLCPICLRSELDRLRRYIANFPCQNAYWKQVKYEDGTYSREIVQDSDDCGECEPCLQREELAEENKAKKIQLEFYIRGNHGDT